MKKISFIVILSLFVSWLLLTSSFEKEKVVRETSESSKLVSNEEPHKTDFSASAENMRLGEFQNIKRKISNLENEIEHFEENNDLVDMLEKLNDKTMSKEERGRIIKSVNSYTIKLGELADLEMESTLARRGK